jgi:hypothetical protein
MMLLSSPGRGSAWLERVVWDHEVEGSNPSAPTNVINNLQGIAAAARFL